MFQGFAEFQGEEDGEDAAQAHAFGIGIGGGWSLTKSDSNASDNDLSWSLQASLLAGVLGVDLNDDGNTSVSGYGWEPKLGASFTANLTLGKFNVKEYSPQCAGEVAVADIEICEALSRGADPWGGESVGFPILSSPDMPPGTAAGHSDTLQTDAVDPNFISGPAGFGPNNFITGDSTIPYLIGFENKPTANAPAQQVVVTETLDVNLDLTTFQLGDFGFGNMTVHVPDDEDRQAYRRRIDASTTLGIYIDVNAALNPQTRIVTWTFTSLDPHTLDLPLDPGSGFLPPNRTPPEGDGWVTYFVQPKAGLATGTLVSAQASVVFDTNAPVATNVYTNLLDTAAPTSHVNALPSIESNASFTVTWAGNDGAGSGIATYDVFVAKDGGAFAPFVAGTTATSAVFQGATGHAYGFYSLATDNLGFREAAKTTAEATTQVTLATCANDVSAQVQVTRSGFGFNLTTQRFVQTITLKNISNSVISGPLSLVLDNLSSNATLFNLSGNTACAALAGSPFINLTGDLNPGASVSVSLQFGNPTKAGITYAARVLSGSAPR